MEEEKKCKKCGGPMAEDGKKCECDKELCEHCCNCKTEEK